MTNEEFLNSIYQLVEQNKSVKAIQIIYERFRKINNIEVNEIFRNVEIARLNKSTSFTLIRIAYYNKITELNKFINDCCKVFDYEDYLKLFPIFKGENNESLLL